MLTVLLWLAWADPSGQLLSAAASGKTAEVEALLARGAQIEAADKDGRTPLMLAAGHNRAAAVKLLLSKGANPEARDRQGWTAYGLALLAGHSPHEDVLQLLPQPAPVRLLVESRWVPLKLSSSCFMPGPELEPEFEKLHLVRFLTGELLAVAGRKLVEFVEAGQPADAQLRIEIQPGVACQAQTGDRLTLAIEVQLTRGGRALLNRSFGGGFKGLRTQTATSPAQYGPVFEAWIKPTVAPIYWAVVEALLRSGP
jgi:hypothetical protein